MVGPPCHLADSKTTEGRLNRPSWLREAGVPGGAPARIISALIIHPGEREGTVISALITARDSSRARSRRVLTEFAP